MVCYSVFIYALNQMLCPAVRFSVLNLEKALVFWDGGSCSLSVQADFMTSASPVSLGLSLCLSVSPPRQNEHTQNSG